MQDAQGIAANLRGVEGEYLFFGAYLHQDSEQANWDVNGALLSNFLEALEITGAVEKLKRVILITGCKQYGLQLGLPKEPMEESDPWVEGPGRPPNFYYIQQRILAEKAKANGYDWVVTYPNDVIGVARGTPQNMGTALGLYCAISKELDGNLMFPGSPAFYTSFDCFTSSRLHAQFCLWAALEPKCSKQGFNVVNGDTQSWQSMWPKLAERFRCHIPRDQFSVSVGEDPGSSIQLADSPPIADVAAQLGLEGRTPPSRVEQKIDLVKWSQRDDVQTAWKKLRDRDGLDSDAFGNATWAFLGFVLGRNYPIVISMSKARKYGWTGYQDTWESISETLDRLEEEKVLPISK